MRVLGVPGAYARRGFRRLLLLSLACGGLAPASWDLGHPVGAALLGALCIALLRRALAWRRGAEGEAQVSRTLEAADLPGWAVNNVVLWRPQGDLDHVVLLPWGVFVLETKSSGALACDAAARQARRKAASLETFLRRRGAGLGVRPVVVHTGPSPVRPRSGPEFRENTAVHASDLIRFLGAARSAGPADAESRKLAATLAARSESVRPGPRESYKSPVGQTGGR